MNNYVKKLLSFSLSLFLICSFLPTNVQSEEEGKILIYALPWEFGEYSYFTAFSYSTVMWMGACLSGLYVRDSANNRLHSPALADGVPIIEANDSSMNITVTLKSGLKFFNGEPITIDDVIFSYKLFMGPESATNLEVYNYLTKWLTNDSIIKVNDNSLKFILSEKFGHFRTLLSHPIFPKAQFEDRYNSGDFDYNDITGADVNSAGPFMIENISSSLIFLKKNPFFYGPEPKVDKLAFVVIEETADALAALEAKEVDIIDPFFFADHSALKALNGVTIDYVPSLAWQECAVNHANGFLNGSLTPFGLASGGEPSDYAEYGKHVRKAISHLVDRETIVDDVMEGLGIEANTVISKSIPGWDASLPFRNFSIEIAKNYMEMAGFNYTEAFGTRDFDPSSINETNNLFELYLITPNSYAHRIVWSQMLEEELPKLGIHVAFNAIESWSYIMPITIFAEESLPGFLINETHLGGWDLLFVGAVPVGGMDINPSQIFGTFSAYANILYTGFYNLSMVYLNELDRTEQLLVFQELQALFYDWEASIPIVYPVSALTMLDTVSGVDGVLMTNTEQQWEIVDCSRTFVIPAEPLPSDTDDEGSSSLSFLIPVVLLVMIPLFRKRRLK